MQDLIEEAYQNEQYNTDIDFDDQYEDDDLDLENQNEQQQQLTINNFEYNVPIKTIMCGYDNDLNNNNNIVKIKKDYITFELPPSYDGKHSPSFQMIITNPDKKILYTQFEQEDQLLLSLANVYGGSSKLPPKLCQIMGKEFSLFITGFTNKQNGTFKVSKYDICSMLINLIAERIAEVELIDDLQGAIEWIDTLIEAILSQIKQSTTMFRKGDHVRKGKFTTQWVESVEHYDVIVNSFVEALKEYIQFTPYWLEERNIKSINDWNLFVELKFLRNCL